MKWNRKHVRAIACALGLGLVTAACASTSAPSAPPSPRSAPPTAIISLSPSATDMLFAIGAGKQVRAVDSDSTYPAQAPRTKLSGYDPNLEAILAYHPDLVVISYNPRNIAGALKKFHVRVLYEGAPSNVAGIYAQIDQLGQATGHVAAAADVVAAMRSGIAALTSRLPRRAHPLSYYYELSSTYYSATSSTFIGNVLGLLGLRNIADAAKGAGSGYPQLSAEYIVASNPDVIFLDDSVTPAQLAARPGWQDVTAVRLHQIYVLNQDIASQWGPRIVELLRAAAADIARAAP